ncbi:MAG TPA: hypothetical protein VMF03_05720, partial [Steroidobacteraceae bacterium]|nr:hypothetical protein [Steroidobacteraceae bacterium]
MFINNLLKISAVAAAAVGMLAAGGCSKPSSDATADVGSAASSAPAATKVACDRQCLIDATDAYVAALVAHDPSKAPLADNVAFVENVTKMKPGEGLWKNIVKGPSSFVIHVPDPINETAGYLAMVTYMGPQQAPQGASPKQREEFAKKPPVEQPAIIAIRLKFDDQGKITEAEHLVSGVRQAQMVNLQTPRPGIFTEIPVAQRKPHDELIKIGASYYDALDDNNGDLAPFAPDCERHENGMITASGAPSTMPATPGKKEVPHVARDCRGQISSNTFQYIAHIVDRRVFAADPETGLVMGLSHFRHPMDNLPYKVKNTDGSTSEKNKKNMPFAPFDLPAAHIFKVGPDGQIHEIE